MMKLRFKKFRTRGQAALLVLVLGVALASSPSLSAGVDTGPLASMASSSKLLMPGNQGPMVGIWTLIYKYYHSSMLAIDFKQTGLFTITNGFVVTTGAWAQAGNNVAWLLPDSECTLYKGKMLSYYAMTGTMSSGSSTGVWIATRASAPGSLCLESASYLALEGTIKKVKVKRLYGADGTVSVNYVITPKSALPWQDYTPKSGTLIWTNRQNAPKTIKIPILADGQTEGNETFQLVLKNPVGAILLSPAKATITILANSKATAAGANATVSRMARLTDALDDGGLTWFTSDRAPWTKQAFVTVDGVDAAISGPSTSGQASWLETVLEGPGKLGFDWLVKGAGKDTCLVFVNGKIRRTLIPGYEWSRESLTLGEGDHAVRWVFVGGTGLAPGSTYLDQVKWTPVGE